MAIYISSEINKGLKMPQTNTQTETWGLTGVVKNKPTTLSINPPTPPTIPELYVTAMFMYLAYDFRSSTDNPYNKFINSMLKATHDFDLSNGKDVMLAALVDLSDRPDQLIIKIRDSHGVLHEKNITEPELNMGDPNTLINFINEARNQAGELVSKAIIISKAILYINSHGFGFEGVGYDEHPEDILTPIELKSALKNAGLKFSIIYLHACTAGVFEMVYDLRGLADYLVAAPTEIGADCKNYTKVFEEYIMNSSLFVSWANGDLSSRDYAVEIADMLRRFRGATVGLIMFVIMLDTDINNNGINDIRDIKNYLGNLSNGIINNWGNWQEKIEKTYNLLSRIISNKPRQQGMAEHIVKQYAYISSIFSFWDSEVYQKISSLIAAITIKYVSQQGADYREYGLGVFFPKYFGNGNDTANFLSDAARVYMNHGDEYCSFCKDTDWVILVKKIYNLFFGSENPPSPQPPIQVLSHGTLLNATTDMVTRECDMP